jgi:trimeric autotransporter adhesin
MAILTINGTGGDDTIVIEASGTDNGSYSINGGRGVLFSGVTQLAVNGGAGNDTLTIVNPTGGLFAPSAGTTVNGGGQSGDALEVLGGAANNGTYAAGATPDAGTLTHENSEVQQVTVGGSSGTFTLTFEGYTTGALAFNATAAQVATALNGLASIGGSFGVVGVTKVANVYTVAFGGPTMVNANEPQMTSAGAGGATATVSTLVDGGAHNITFSGLAPVTDTVAAGMYTVTGTASTDTITVADGAVVGGAQTTQISSPTFESISFANKGTVYIDGKGGGDIVTFSNPNPAAGITELNLLGVGAVIQTAPVKLANLSIDASGDVQLTSSGNMVGKLAASVAGSLSFIDSSPLIVGAFGGIDGITAANHAVTLTADNLDVAAQINAGTGTVTLQPVSAGRTIGLGGADSASVLGLTDAELDHVAAGTLRVGSGTSGTINITFTVSPAGTNQLELTTGADIQPNGGSYPHITVARLAMTAGTGIGVNGSFFLLGADVGNLEAQTNTGDINIQHVGATILTLGGVTPALTGLKVVTSGNIVVTTDTSIVLADTDGLATVTGGSSSGDVTLQASLGSSDVTSTVNKDAIMAPAGNITVQAGRDILLGTAGATFDNDVHAHGSVNFSAGRDIAVDGFSFIGSDGIGGVTATAGRNISLADTGLITASGNVGGSVSLTTGANGSLTLSGSAPKLTAISSASGDVSVTADRVAISTSSVITASAPGHSVTIAPVSSAWAVNLGSTTDAAASTLELSDAELDHISTPTLRIGSASNIGNITVSSQITADNHYGTLSLRTGGGIVDGTAAEQTDITVDNLALRATAGIGSANDLDVAVSNLAFNNTTLGDVIVSDATGLTIGAVDGLASSSFIGGNAHATATGALTVASSITSTGQFPTGQIILQTSDTAAAGDDVTVLAGATLAGTFISLVAGDNVTLQAGSTVQSTGAFFTNVDFGSADPGVGGTNSFSGTVISGGVVIIGGADADTLIGTAFDDSLIGGAGANNAMIGGAGNDSYLVDAVGDVVTENPGEGTDTVNASVNFALPANVENLTLTGSADLQGYGNNLVNTITGNGGNNLIDGGSGADLMVGGAGNDTYLVDSAGDTVTENANQGNDTVFASVSFTLSANVENLILQGGADLQGYGNALTNVIYGNGGNNLIDGGGGADLMVGGAGNDTYFVDDPSDSAFEVAGEGNDTVLTTANYGLAANVENLVMQGTADLQGYGSNQANVLYGNTGNNLLNGAGGIDLMVGGVGNDTYFVDDPSDSCFEAAGEGNDAVFAFCNYGLAADVETLVLQGSADLQGYGNNQANTLYGNAGNNLINGGGGADTMLGGIGNDTYFVDNVGDVVFENAGEGTDAVLSGVSYTLSANVEALVLQGGGNLNGTGNAQANNIFGNTGNNVLDGAGGADVLTGDAGNDTFIFHAGQADGDTVVDFAGNGAAAGDSLQFVGYGGGATFTQIDATHWQVNYNFALSHDHITFMNGAAIHPSDYLFS